MAYGDEHIEQAEKGAPVRDNIARSSLKFLMQRHGYGGPLTDKAAKNHGTIFIRSMGGDPEQWVLDGEQAGTNWKDKTWKRVR